MGRRTTGLGKGRMDTKEEEEEEEEGQEGRIKRDSRLGREDKNNQTINNPVRSEGHGRAEIFVL